MTKPDSTSPSPAERLAAFRARIDAMDERISQLLIERTAIIAEVAALKAAHWPGRNHIRPAREGQMHQAVARRFAGTDIPPIAALGIWRQMIGAATSLESPLKAVSLIHQPHHAWLAREYFGVGVGNRSEASLADMLEVMQQGEANILLLPAAESSDWWRDALLFKSHGLHVFATLPVTTQPMPLGVAPALALAPVQPEPSGDDRSYLVLVTHAAVEASELASVLPAHVISADSTHHLLVVDGFITEASAEYTALTHALGARLLSLTVLGAHPLPVSL